LVGEWDLANQTKKLKKFFILLDNIILSIL